MHPSLAFLAPLALLAPVFGGENDAASSAALLPRVAAPEAVEIEAFGAIDPAELDVVRQVRIEQRVTIRIAPRDPAVRPSMLAQITPPSGSTANLAERKIGKCVPISGISAVQPDPVGRLLLFMRDQRLVAASLEKTCHPREFYAGFYLERTGDGLLCVDRDKLHSRAGTSCSVSKLRQLVAADD